MNSSGVKGLRMCTTMCVLMRCVLMATMFLLAGGITSPVRAQTQIVFSQPPNPAGGVIKSAWYPPNGLDGDAYAYDSFVLSANAAITEIDWRGGYTNILSGAGISPVFDFTISIYASIAAGIQPDVVHPPLVQYSVGGNAGETPVGTFGGVPMYDYSFVLPSPFQAIAGTKYWVQIEASQGVTPTYGWPPDWSIAVGTGGDNSHFYQITGGTNGGGNLFYTSASDLAFTLRTAAAPTVNIAASVSPAGFGAVSGTGAYPTGAIATLSATPNAGYGFVNWTENGVPVSNSTVYSFTANADRTLVANFTTAATITTSSAPIYGGGTNGDGIYNSGASVTVTATPSNGYVFAGWSESGTAVSAAASYTFTAAGNRTLVANFAPGPSTATFDFDTATPLLVATQAGTPLDQTSAGVTAHFTSPTVGAGGFSVQSDATTHFHLSQFSGNYLYPNSVYSPALDIQFSQPLTSITFTYATADFTQANVPTTIQVTAYQNSTANPAVGSASGHALYGTDTMPMSTLTFTSATPFDVVEITIPPAPLAASDFLVDNIIAVTAQAPPSATPTSAGIAATATPTTGQASAATPTNGTAPPPATATAIQPAATATPSGAAATAPTNTPMLPTATATATATQTAEEAGFVPPDKNTGACEDKVARNLSDLAGCLTKCQIKQADASLNGKVFDEEGCEQGSGLPLSCRARFDNASTTLAATQRCPACLDSAGQAHLADLLTTAIEGNSAQIYCAGTTGFGGDDSGLIPPDALTSKCEDKAAMNLANFGSCMTRCQIKQADAALNGKAFDEESCEQGSGRPLSCRAAYNNTSLSLLALRTASCPPCLGLSAQAGLADAMTALVETMNGQIYCAGTQPLPLP